MASRYQAHPDRTARYLAHRDEQPVVRWERIAYRVAEAVVMAALVVELVYLFFVWAPGR